ncbi:MAG TPA: bifunctional adenosylcobinamide kinase/adenosylcobinamide-phosphate guanylyltransferase [Burkholderiales bacterium]|nr:bifunctional adenosylcobinamide kinase/adenosylcobinamide-phosphate guanylyltransferase [Burkholderiales bacterium]
MKELILGGVRSGKSRLAEQRAMESGLAVVYVATATPEDDEMRSRIEAHRRRRPAEWLTVEEPRALARALQSHAREDRCVLVECLTLWLTNLLGAESPRALEVERAALLAAVPGLPGRLILVSNETGSGVVPMGPVSRVFCDEAGRLHQDLARICDRVTLTVAGLALPLKGSSC